jgi:hypothetical protein
MITAFDEAVADAVAMFNASMVAKFEAILDIAELETTEWAFATLRQERLEFQEQLMINQRTFQTNMLNMLVTSQQNTIDCIMNNQATLQQTLQAQLNLFELSIEQQALPSPPMLPDSEILTDSDLPTLAPSALAAPSGSESNF